jgi:CRP/FNR family transcriptional activator FtrB
MDAEPQSVRPPEPRSAPPSAPPEAPWPPTSPIEALERTEWLRHVPPATLARLARRSVLHRMPAGSVLFEQSGAPTFAHLLVAGTVELVGIAGGTEALIETVHPVDLLLPAAVLNDQPFLARASVLEEAQLVLIHADAFRDAVASDHALCLAVLACQAAQFRRQMKLAKNLKLRPAEDRVGCYLLRLVQGSPVNTPVQLPLEKRRIAGQLGMTRETFSRTLAAMSRYGLRVSGDTVTVIDPAALQARFQLDPLIDAPEPVEPIAPRAG